MSSKYPFKHIGNSLLSDIDDSLRTPAYSRLVLLLQTLCLSLVRGAKDEGLRSHLLLVGVGHIVIHV